MGSDKTKDLKLISSSAPQIRIHHPDTRAVLSLSLGEFLLRVERGLSVGIEARWVGVLAALADGLFVHPDIVLRRTSDGAGFVEGTGPQAKASAQAAWLGEMEEAGIVESASIESIYRSGRLATLERPRTWELNGWWERLFGAIPMPSAEDDGDDEEDDGLDLGVQSHPFGLQSEDNQIRTLLSQGLLNQGEVLIRLRVSVHEQNRILTVMRHHWRIDGEGGLSLPDPSTVDETLFKTMEAALGLLNPTSRKFCMEAMAQLIALGMVEKAGDFYISAVA